VAQVSNTIYDVLVVGSGLSGVHATYPLVEAGLRVAMIDGGLDANKRDGVEKAPRVIGAKSNALDILMKGSFAFNKTYELLSVKSNIEIIQTLAKGGLSEFWHGLSDFLTDDELVQAGLSPDQIKEEYKVVSKLVNLDTSPELDVHGKLLLKRSPHGVYRLPVTYPYRTSEVVNKLKHHRNFTYLPGQLVLTVKERNRMVEVGIRPIQPDSNPRQLLHGRTKSVRGKYVVLAAGAINTTRILLRSKNLYNHKTTFLTKNHSMIVCFHPQVFFKSGEKVLINPGQLGIISNDLGQKLGAFVQLYRANPFMLSSAVQYVPLPRPIATMLLSLFMPSLVIADVRFPAFETKNKFCQLRREKNGGDILEIAFRLTQKEVKTQRRELEVVSKTLRSIGLFPLKVVSDPVTSHYGGGVPIGGRGKLATDINGRLKKSKRIYVADSSTWRALPGKPLALTMMANASRIAKEVLKKLRK